MVRLRLDHLLLQGAVVKWREKPDWTKPLPTSAVALRESVTIRAVEQWCDFGTVPARKTPGGHWRIARNYSACVADPEESEGREEAE